MSEQADLSALRQLRTVGLVLASLLTVVVAVALVRRPDSTGLWVAAAGVVLTWALLALGGRTLRRRAAWESSNGHGSDPTDNWFNRSANAHPVVWVIGLAVAFRLVLYLRYAS